MDRRLVTALVVIGFFLLVGSEELPPRLVLLAWLLFAALCYGAWSWSHRTVSISLPTMPTWTPHAPRAAEINLNDPRIEELRQIEALPVETARQRITLEMPRNVNWRVLGKDIEHVPRVRELTPNQQWFFSEFGGIEAAFGGARVSRDEVRGFKWPASTVLPFGTETGAQSQPFLRLGVDMDENPVLAKKGEETVYVVHGTRSSADRWWCSDYPSLFHWILTTNRR